MKPDMATYEAAPEHLNIVSDEGGGRISPDRCSHRCCPTANAVGDRFPDLQGHIKELSVVRQR